MGFLTHAAAFNKNQELELRILFQSSDHRRDECLQFLYGIMQVFQSMSDLLSNSLPSHVENCSEKSELSAKVFHELRLTGPGSASDGGSGRMFVTVCRKKVLGRIADPFGGRRGIGYGH